MKYNYIEILENIRNNPQLGKDICLGWGSERVAYSVNDLSVKVDKCLMNTFEDQLGLFKKPTGISQEQMIELYNYCVNIYRHSEDMFQTEEEIVKFDMLTVEEKN